MRNRAKLSVGLAVVWLFVVGVSASAGGFFTNGLPRAGQAPYPSTMPLTGAETIPADTNLGGGAQPQSEAITVVQLAQAANLAPYGGASYNADNATGSFTASVAEVSGAKFVVLDLTGALGAGANVTTPSAAVLIGTLPGAQDGQAWTLRIVNNSSGAFTWTVVGGANVTVAGTATVAQNTFRDFVLTLSASGGTATLQNVGSGNN